MADDEMDYYLAANTHREGGGTLNNEKTVHQNSPPPVDMIDNQVSGRSGGPCSPQGNDLGTCGHCHPNNKITFECGCYKRVCSSCERNYYNTCPKHPECYRK